MIKVYLSDIQKNRFYLIPDEIEKILLAAKDAKPYVRTLVETLVYTGCHISEALELTPKRIDLKHQNVVFRSLKKKNDNVFRSVPVPYFYVDTMVAVHHIYQRQKSNKRLWTWTRPYAYELIKDVMIYAGISAGNHRNPKAIRHAYGVRALLCNVPLSYLQRWMGHTDVNSTAIYTDFIKYDTSELVKALL